MENKKYSYNKSKKLPESFSSMYLTTFYMIMLYRLGDSNIHAHGLHNIFSQLDDRGNHERLSMIENP